MDPEQKFFTLRVSKTGCLIQNVASGNVASQNVASGNVQSQNVASGNTILENSENISPLYYTNKMSYHPTNAEPSSQYDLKFKAKLKSKGRPPNPSKQHTFNKTLEKKNKSKRKPVCQVLADMARNTSDNDDDDSCNTREPLHLPVVDSSVIDSSSDIVANSLTSL